MIEEHAYRIGWTTNRKWWHPHRPWQAESDMLRYARRAFTPAGAERKIRRDEDKHGWTPHQRYRAVRDALSAALCPIVGHRPYRVIVGPWPHVTSRCSFCDRCLAHMPEEGSRR